MTDRVSDFSVCPRTQRERWGGDEDTERLLQKQRLPFSNRSKGINGTLMKGILMWTTPSNEQLEKTARNSFSRKTLKSLCFMLMLKGEREDRESVMYSMKRNIGGQENWAVEKENTCSFHLTSIWLVECKLVVMMFQSAPIKQKTSWKCLTEEDKKEVYAWCFLPRH